ncbi:hypothetical protein [uncultured Pseudacidovorax sp.]|uniref:hypothetical protein n=1 Tax=uncultured Pseudacidovorax sp. TaxID=679313 RepID=UPI0025EE9869|nr:hypothetical protein [uncultured Pseudacidovorax sp.]
MSNVLDRPTLAESLASAGNSSNLTVDPDRRGDVDVLIAAGKASHVVGRYLDQLVSEWGACAPPRRYTKEDIERLAQTYPPVTAVKGGREVHLPDIARAHAQVQSWQDAERRAVIARLKSLPRLMDGHAGVIPWMRARGIQDPELVLLDVLGWYLERRCAVCGGTKWQLAPGTNRQSSQVCRACGGSGERTHPHGLVGYDVLAYLATSASKARDNMRAVLAQVRRMKAVAAGRVC